ncbi:hypothetical protein BGZ94_007291 [Podila epigama]|nr:hypothetical protein BGZ94_007291 [Podila epigama]
MGTGKTTITNKIVSTLSSAPHHLRVFTFSMDDLYLPYKEQERLRDSYPDNKLIEFRGLPGTHDLKLGVDTFSALCEANHSWYVAENDRINQDNGPIAEKHRPIVAQPSYDKAAYSGRGDQVPKDKWKLEQGPFDVVLFEGWSLGFKSIRDSELIQKLHKEPLNKDLFLKRHSLESLIWIDQALKAYERDWYGFLDIFVHLSAPNLQTIFKWREEQEQDLRRRKGAGMNPDQVRDFVSRFMPAYELYLERLKTENVFSASRQEHEGNQACNEGTTGIKLTGDIGHCPLPFRGRHLRVDLDGEREMIATVLVE